MNRQRKWAFLFLAVLLVGTAAWLWNWTPEVLENTVVTQAGVVIDRAMSDGLPYLSVELEDGSTVMCWNLYKKPVPESVTFGSRVVITYGIEEAHCRSVILDVKHIEPNQ